MSKNNGYVPIEELWRQLPKEHRTRNRIEAAIRDEKIRVIHGRRRGDRRIHLGDSRKFMKDVREVFRLERTTTDPWNDNGVVKLPVGILTKPGPFTKQGHRRDTIGRWCREGCPRLPKGRKLKGKIYLAIGKRGKVESLIPALFVWQDDWQKVENANPIPRGRRTTKKAPVARRKKAKKLDRRIWASTEATMRCLSVNDPQQLYVWSRDGFPTPDGKHLPLAHKCENQWRGKTRWNHRHVVAIKPYRDAQKRDEPQAVFEPFPLVENGKRVMRLRIRAVANYFKKAGIKESDVKISRQLLWEWENKGCPADDGKKLDVVEVPSICSTKPTEGAARVDQLDRIIAAFKKSKKDYDQADFSLNDRGIRFVPQHIAVQYVALNEIFRDRKLREEERKIATTTAKLPWRPGHAARNWGKEQIVYSEPDLLGHPKALRTKSIFDEHAAGNGHVAAEPTKPNEDGVVKPEQPAPAAAAAVDKTAGLSSDDRIIKALKLRKDNPDWSDRKVAREAGFPSHGTLVRNPLYQKARALGTRHVRGGFKKSDGTLEAIDEAD